MAGELDIINRLVKELQNQRQMLIKWAREHRQNNFGRKQEIEMMQKALEIDKLMRFLGVEWLEDESVN